MKYTTTLLLATLLSAGAFAAHASEGYMGKMEKRMQHMTENLDLNEEQQLQMREIMKSHRKERKAMKEHKADKIRSILTPAQQEKFDQHRAEKKARREERGVNHKNCEHGKGRKAS